jgi:tellurite methyltransferase
MKRIQEQFGNIDIYLFDQLLKRRFDDCDSVLDAGCGDGRNLVYFLQNDFEVYGIDKSLSAINEVKSLSATLNPENPLNNFVVGEIDEMPFESDLFDVVLCNAVLHFAHNKQHFEKMLHSLWRVLLPGGHLLIRLASDIGIEQLVNPLDKGRYRLPDGSARYLVNLQMLVNYTKELGGELFESIKTTNVQNVRCMTTWCIKKNA